LTKVSNVDYRKIIKAKESSELITLISGKEFAYVFFAQLVFHGIPQPEMIEPIQQMHSFISDNFSWCTVADFKLAFEFNAAGKLANKLNAFKSFDATYVGSVLDEYYKMRMEAMKKWNDVNTNYIEPSHQLASSTTYDEKQMFMTSLSTDIEKAKKGNLMAATLLGTIWFDKLYKYELVTDDLWTDLEWSYFKSMATDTVKHERELTKTKFTKIKENERLYELYQQDVKNEMKRLMYVDYIKKQTTK
jgi:hypothetical protein